MKNFNLENLKTLENNDNFNLDQETSKKMTGLPSVDKPWEKYYDKEKLSKQKPKKTVYQEVYDNNKEYGKDLAIEYFGSRTNYKTFFDQINSTAKSFEEYGIKKGDFVTICAAGIPETAYSFYALSKIGAIANMIAPHFDKNDFVERIGDCESDFLIVMDIFYDEIKEAVKKSRIKNIIVLPTLNSSLLKYISKKYKLEKYSNELFWNQFIKDGEKRKETITIPYEKNMPLSMVYSSGTTGASKGILLSNDSFQNSVHSYGNSGINISRNQKFYQIIPPWYSTGLSTSMHLPLSYGSSVFMDPRFERDIFVKNVVKAKPNYSVAPTSMYEGFLDSRNLKNKDLSFFNYPFEGGEPLRAEVAESIQKVFKEHGNTSKLMVGYGQCECGATITTQTQNLKSSIGSVGIPLPGITIGIFDDDFNEVSYNERGQVFANTPCSMLEYYKNKEQTKKYFYIDKNGIKWNCTGDIGYIDKNGELFVQGRASDYSIISNDKIFNFDVENILMSLDEIKLCDVINRTNENGNQTLVAHIIFKDTVNNLIQNNYELLIEKLNYIQNYIYEKTSNENMIPYVFKVRKDFPYAKSGKRDVAKLKVETEGFIELPVFKSNSNVKKLKK